MVYLILATIILGMNVIPFFMPPTWAVLAYFVVKYELYILPVILIGASCATAGRVVLSIVSEKYFRKFLSSQSKTNYESIGQYLNKHRSLTIPLMLTYAFFPIPSNHVFIAAGLAKVKIMPLAISFFIGRLISYTFWIKLTQHLTDNLEDLFSFRYSKIGSVGIEIAGLLILYFVGKIAWKKILKSIEKQ